MDLHYNLQNNTPLFEIRGYATMRNAMNDPELDLLQTVLRRHWSGATGARVQEYIGKFSTCMRIGTHISGQVQGNHGLYKVSISVDGDSVAAACSCYIGKGGGCHHCAALAHTFLKTPTAFQVIVPKERNEVSGLGDLKEYLAHTTLESLVQQLKEHGITQSAFAESIGCSSQHLAAVKRSELRHHYFHELGALKLACLWVLEHRAEFAPPPISKRKRK